MKKIAIIIVLIGFFSNVYGQEPAPENIPYPQFNIGLGGGLDYGGYGGRLTALASQRFELFAALGYNLLGAGFNGGIDLRLSPKTRICPYLGAMYGYNAVIKISGAPEYNKTYYGPSFALGLEFWSKRRPSFFNLELLIPIRSSQCHTDYDNLKNNPNISITSEMLPVAVSIGYHFTLSGGQVAQTNKDDQLFQK